MLECWNRSIVMSLASWNHTTADPPSGMVSVCGDPCIHLLGEGPDDSWNTDEHSDIACIYKHYPLLPPGLENIWQMGTDLCSCVDECAQEYAAWSLNLPG